MEDNNSDTNTQEKQTEKPTLKATGDYLRKINSRRGKLSQFTIKKNEMMHLMENY